MGDSDASHPRGPVFAIVAALNATLRKSSLELQKLTTRAFHCLGHDRNRAK